MRVTEVRTYCCRDDVWGRFLFVVVDTDAGIRGYGEAGLPAYGNAAACERAVRHLAELVVGEDPWATERIWQRMWRAPFFPAGVVYGSAASAIDIALWDIKGKAAGLPVYKLLGGPVRDKVVCYPHCRGNTTQTLVDDCLRHVDAGWRFVRWGMADAREQDAFDPSGAVAHCVEQAESVRHAVGPSIGICIDVHTRIDTPHAITLCRQLERVHPFFVEDPIRSEHPASYETLARHVAVPIAAGEQWAGKWMFTHVIERELIAYCRVDLCIAGGLTEARKIAGMCEAHHIDLVPHNPLGPVSAAACVALCMASTNVGVQEMPLAPGSFAQAVAPRQIRFEGGYAWCDDAPGLGVELDEEACAARRWEPSGYPPLWRRSDGAYTNW